MEQVKTSQFEQICKNIDVWSQWRDQYKIYVPLFIEEAKQNKHWSLWEKDLFFEFFEKSNDQCVSSLRQGYFTNKEKQDIKDHWDELSPLFAQIAENQDIPQWEAYDALKKTIRKYTKVDRRAATNRLVASLQPRLLSTIVNEDNLSELYWFLQHKTDEQIPPYVGGNWFQNSYNILQFFKQKLTDLDYYDIITYPWQVRDSFLHAKSKNEQVTKKQNMEIDFLKKVKNVIYTGAPGTGKTYKAKQLAKTITNYNEDQDDGRIAFVQFHPSYDYTDFVEGLRPVKSAEQKEVSFELRDGIFRSFCERAKNDEENDYVLVIDEINRGEISKIFGELFFSIDPGYRGRKGSVLTQYANLRKKEDQYFYVPDNVYIIGTMNDIDRSVESFDFAMRRRFAWREIKASEQTDMWLGKIDAWIDEAQDRMERLNKAIEKTEGLSSAYHIGPAYFLVLKDHDGDFSKLWNYHIEPLLTEYLRGFPNPSETLKKLQWRYDGSDIQNN
ncbi:5-methylcytosine-specific restriction enzyme B [Draconibacterium orientale]|uniref:5-methylcytosine-specific restriction enzyme B n=1 Tax=Draconibacterium orientale TaxID=1168034 RepID=X5E348_9BACT|nr:AAA family ATPase [Draconibacterium orientale]AHW61046.1 endonuclease [Draconibacterium orientale]SET54893.1 5-methylcytosine-specific restriction enzyme B [Draconibacterium orientale]